MSDNKMEIDLSDFRYIGLKYDQSGIRELLKSKITDQLMEDAQKSMRFFLSNETKIPQSEIFFEKRYRKKRRIYRVCVEDNSIFWEEVGSGKIAKKLRRRMMSGRIRVV